MFRALCRFLFLIAVASLFPTGMGLAQTAASSHDELCKCVPGIPQLVFTAPQGEDTECPALAPNGDLYTAEVYSGKIYRIKRDGSSEVFTTLFAPGAYPYLQCLGIVFGPNHRDLYVLANTWDPATHGVWRVRPDRSKELVVPIPPNGSFLNEMIFDGYGNLYVTDSTLGAVWKISHDGQLNLWCVSPLLIWGTDPTGPFGANGIALWHDTLYVAVTDAGAGLLPTLRGSNYPVVTIPIMRDGSAGAPQVFVKDGILAPDGLATDEFGNLYIVDFGGLAWGPGFPLAGPARLLRIHADGKDMDVIAEVGLQNSASVVIHDGFAYVTNMYVTDVPNIVKIDLCTNHRCH